MGLRGVLEESLASVEADLDAARSKGSWSSVSQMQRLAYQIRRDLFDEASVERPEDDDEASLVDAVIAGLATLPDEALPRAESALAARRESGRK